MFDSALLEDKFARIGARLKVDDGSRRRRFIPGGTVVIDVGSDRDGEFFEVAGEPKSVAEIEVLDVQRDDRHLLLMVRQSTGKHKYLCGHDERHWFVAAIPESAPVGTVTAAKEALKPAEVRIAQAKKRLGARAGNKRKNAANRRQGEWFFIPAPELKVDEKLVIRDEPISRGNGGKPHRCEFCYRTGGQTVYVCRNRPRGLTVDEYRALLASKPHAKSWGWEIRRRDALVYAKGRVRHPDHRVITLHGWHRVVMNTETQAVAMRNLAFID